MILKILFFLSILMSPQFTEGMPQLETFDRSAFYQILKSGSAEDIDNEIAILTDGTIIEKNAYIGTLLMKKADLITIPKDKLRLFKTGRIKLETEVALDSSNVEYRFLRLIIEEHAPKIVKYRGLLTEDSQFIQKYFKKLSPIVKHAVIDYSKTSKILHPENF